jgi:DNA-binding LacI/PurR family transcriptional regulator
LVTVHDVAARSGVSIATVSRTLREPHRVSDNTRARVLAAVRDLGYRPNRAASSLRRGRTGVIALVVPDIENPYFASLTKGAQALARARGYGLVVVDSTEDAEVETDEIAALRSQIDGIILASSRLSDDRLAEAVAGISCVLINRSVADPGIAAPTVTIDEHAGGAAALGHLHALGHRRIAYVGGPASAVPRPTSAESSSWRSRVTRRTPTEAEPRRERSSPRGRRPSSLTTIWSRSVFSRAGPKQVFASPTRSAWWDSTTRS